jgi:hypothetical protein
MGCGPLIGGKCGARSGGGPRVWRFLPSAGQSQSSTTTLASAVAQTAVADSQIKVWPTAVCPLRTTEAAVDPPWSGTNCQH